MKKDLLQEAARIREDWNREKVNLEAALRRVQDVLSRSSSSLTSESTEKAAILEKSIRRHLEESERSVQALEKRSYLQYRQQAIDRSYGQLCKLFGYLDLVSDELLSLRDLSAIDILGESSKDHEDPAHTTHLEDGSKRPEQDKILYLEAILTNWQSTAASVIERELLIPRRIGSLYFFSGENSLLGMKLAFMVRMCVTSPSREHAKLCLKLAGLWRGRNKNLRLDVKTAQLEPSRIMSLFGNRFDALFLDYKILSSWLQEYPSTYAEDLASFERAFPFLILLLKRDQVQLYRDILGNMRIETFSLCPEDPKCASEEVSTLLIARRESRYILQYQQDSWDVMVRDFGWNAAHSAERPRKISRMLPNPYHLSEKILLVSNFGLRAVSTLPSAIWLNQREAACWRRFGGQCAVLPRFISESRTNNEWKIVLQLGEAESKWTFARQPQPCDHLLAQTQSLLETLKWLRSRSLFLNGLRADLLAVHGPELRVLSLERLDSQETEDTLSALLWLWYDLGRNHPPLRPWPIEYFPEEYLDAIPQPLQPVAQFAASSATLDEFLQNLPPPFSKSLC